MAPGQLKGLLALALGQSRSPGTLWLPAYTFHYVKPLSAVAVQLCLVSARSIFIRDAANGAEPFQIR